MLRLMCLAILGAVLAIAQPVPTQVQTFPDQYVRQDPGRCVEGQTLYNLTEHASKRCDSTGTWVAAGGGAATSISAIGGTAVAGGTELGLLFQTGGAVDQDAANLSYSKSLSQLAIGGAVIGGTEPAFLIGGGTEWKIGLAGSLISSEGTAFSIGVDFDPSSEALFDNAFIVEARTKASNSQDIDFAGAINFGFFHRGTGTIGLGGDGYLYSSNGDIENLSTGTLNNARTYYGQLINKGTGNITGTNAVYWADLSATGGGDIANASVLYGRMAKNAGTFSGRLSFIYSEDMGGLATNGYYSWFDSRGVGRCKEDSAFNGTGQTICAVYNNAFPKYTAGAVDFERGVYGEWDAFNVYNMGTEAGGTGTLRPLRLLGAQTLISSLTAAGGATGKKVVCADPLTGQLYLSSTGTDCLN